MRAIKFRAWSGDRMIDNFMYNFTTPEGWQWFNREYHNGVRELMQFTGLRDKNGVEIYEGDIVFMGCETIKGGKHIAEIVFNDGMFYCQIENKAMRIDHGESCGMMGNIPNHLSKFKVIGNIYENPELLEVTK